MMKCWNGIDVWSWVYKGRNDDISQESFAAIDGKRVDAPVKDVWDMGFLGKWKKYVFKEMTG